MPTREASLYTKRSCSFSAGARKVLERNGALVREEKLEGPAGLEKRLAGRLGRRVAPHVVLDGAPVEGLAELLEMEARGELDG